MFFRNKRSKENLLDEEERISLNNDKLTDCSKKRIKVYDSNRKILKAVQKANELEGLISSFLDNEYKKTDEITELNLLIEGLNKEAPSFKKINTKRRLTNTQKHILFALICFLFFLFLFIFWYLDERFLFTKTKNYFYDFCEND